MPARNRRQVDRQTVALLAFLAGVTITAGALLLLGGPGRAQAPTEELEVREILDERLHPFLLSCLHAVRHRSEADMFSEWGYLHLEQAGIASAADLMEKLQRQVLEGGWSVEPEPELDLVDLDPFHGAPVPLWQERWETLAFSLTVPPEQGNDESTRYLSRIWIRANGKTVVMAYRIDTE